MKHLHRYLVFCGLLGAVLSVAGPAAARGRLLTSQGTMRLGGRATVTIQHVAPEFGEGVTGGVLDLSPTFGIFLIDNLVLDFEVGFAIGFGDLHENDPTLLRFGLGPSYFFNFGFPVVPYLGVTLGAQFLFPDQGDTYSSLLLTFPLGLAIPLNRHVAIDLGTRIAVDFGFGTPERTILTIPIGYLGVLAFF